MNIERKYERQSKRLAEMTAQVNCLRAEVDSNKKDAVRASQLISDLEKVQSEWKQELETLKSKRMEYETLIAELRVLKKKMNIPGGR